MVLTIEEFKRDYTPVLAKYVADKNGNLYFYEKIEDKGMTKILLLKPDKFEEKRRKIEAQLNDFITNNLMSFKEK